MKIRFIGAVGSVTGSCTLLEHNGEFFLVDCGAGQDSIAGADTPLDFKARKLRSMFLTHAHLDHCGLIPALIAQGFSGRIYCTAATRDLTLNALRDSSRLGKCKVEHIPTVEQFECPDENCEYKWGKYLPAATDLTVALTRTSHILGSVAVSFQFADPTGNSGRRTVCFSGDIGCNDEENCFQALLSKRLQPDAYPSYLVLESTYGSRTRPPEASSFDQRMAALREMIDAALTLSSEPLVLIPCFTLHRTQELMSDLHFLLSQGIEEEIKCRWAKRLGHEEGESLPLLDVAIESGLAWAHTAIYRRELPRTLNTGKRKALYLNGAFAERAGASPDEIPGMLESLFAEPLDGRPNSIGQMRFHKGSDSLSKRSVRIVIAGSGMCQGGRIVEHLRRGLTDPKVLVVLMGFQAPDTPGAQLRKRIADPYAPLDLARWDLPSDVQAKVMDLGQYYSGHADQSGLVKFALFKDASDLSYVPLRRIFLNHGEQSSREGLRAALMEFASSQAAHSRCLEAIDLPKSDSGWFDLKTNAWTDEIDSRIDAGDAVIAWLCRKVRRLEIELQQLRSVQSSVAHGGQVAA